MIIRNNTNSTRYLSTTVDNR